jgi:hypothetical protein
MGDDLLQMVCVSLLGEAGPPFEHSCHHSLQRPLVLPASPLKTKFIPQFPNRPQRSRSTHIQNSVIVPTDPPLSHTLKPTSELSIEQLREERPNRENSTTIKKDMTNRLIIRT